MFLGRTIRRIFFDAVAAAEPEERFSAYYGLWVGHATRREPAPLREMAELFLREATAPPDCLVAHRISGQTRFYFGDFAGAHDHHQRTVELYPAGVRFGAFDDSTMPRSPQRNG